MATKLEEWMREHGLSDARMATRTRAIDPFGRGVCPRTVMNARRGKFMGDDRALILSAATNWEVHVHDMVPPAWLKSLKRLSNCFFLPTAPGKTRRLPPL